MHNDELENPETENTEIATEEELLALAEKQGLMEASALAEQTNPEEEASSTSKKELTESESNELMASMEAVLFMSDKPVSLPKLRQTINTEVSLNHYRQLMAKLREAFAQEYRGIEIAEFSLGFQLRTKPHMAGVLRKMVKTTPLKLSPTTMEVLSIIAYKQPVTKDEIDQIRGVDSGYVIRNLMEKRLVKISGRSDLPGKPMVYGTTHEFLELFNLKDTNQLPSLHEVESMVAASEVGFDEQMNQVMTGFSKMVQSSDKVLFDDSQIDQELEALRSEIANIPTSTEFLEEQKAREKREARIAELALEGLTLDEHGKVVPIGSLPLPVELPSEAVEHLPTADLATAVTLEKIRVEEQAVEAEIMAEVASDQTSEEASEQTDETA